MSRLTAGPTMTMVARMGDERRGYEKLVAGIGISSGDRIVRVFCVAHSLHVRRH